MGLNKFQVMLQHLLISILFLSSIKLSYSLENKQRSSIPLSIFDGKVLVYLNDDHGLRVVKTTLNHPKLRSVMCRQLGQGPPAAPIGYFYDEGFRIDSVVGADAFDCTGWESELSECRILNASVQYTQRLLLNSDYYLRLECLPAEEEEFTVFLREPLYINDDGGIPFIFFEDSWGPLCYRQTNTNNISNVLCKQLGFGGGTGYPDLYGNSVFWPPVSLNVSCTGEEDSIQDCEYSANLNSTTCDTIAKMSCYPLPTTVGNTPISPTPTTVSIKGPWLVVIIIVGGLAFISLLVSCWKMCKAAAEVPRGDRVAFRNLRGAKTSAGQTSQDRSHNITDVPSQHPSPLTVTTKNSEVPSYEEVAEEGTSLTNVTISK